MADSPKIYPTSHEEIGKILHINDGGHVDASSNSKLSRGPLDLPILEAEAKEVVVPKAPLKEEVVASQNAAGPIKPVVPKPQRAEADLEKEVDHAPTSAGPKKVNRLISGFKT